MGDGKNAYFSKLIPLIYNKEKDKTYFSIIDSEDYEEISKYRWHLHKQFKFQKCIRMSAHTRIKNKTIYMHRMILKPPFDRLVDHKDRNGLNNKRNNIRICTYAQNSQNRKKPNNNTTGYKGLSYVSKKSGYKVEVGGKDIGYSTNKIEAAKMYDKAAKELFGEFARLNFPED